MECPGLRDVHEFMLPRQRVTDDDRRLPRDGDRPRDVAHVVRRPGFPVWWQDAWLNESFADYMGFEVAETVAGTPGTRVSFEAAHKPGAYLADRRRSTHPSHRPPRTCPTWTPARRSSTHLLWQGKRGTAAAGDLGWDGGLLGRCEHAPHTARFANATLADLCRRSTRPRRATCRGWAEVWLRQSGHDTIRVSRLDDVPVLTRDGVRPHRFTVTAVLALAGAGRLAAGRPRGRAIGTSGVGRARRWSRTRTARPSPASS
jgi:aminopeptidase N